MLQTVSRNVRAALRGVRDIELTPRSDYRKYVSTPNEMSARSWNATKGQMWGAIRRLEAAYVKE